MTKDKRLYKTFLSLFLIPYSFSERSEQSIIVKLLNC